MAGSGRALAALLRDDRPLRDDTASANISSMRISPGSLLERASRSVRPDACGPSDHREDAPRHRRPGIPCLWRRGSLVARRCYCPRCAWLANLRASSAARKTPAALLMHSCCSDSGFEVGDDAGAGLHVDLAVLHHRGAEHDAGVHRAVGGEIADAAGIGAALLLLQLVDDLHRAHLRRAGDGAGREAGDERVERVLSGRSSPMTFETMCITWL